MIFEIYAVKDEMTSRFMEPQYFRSEEEAKRNFTYQINNIPMWKDNAADYSLFKLGCFDEEQGFILESIHMIKICGGRSVLKGE